MMDERLVAGMADAEADALVIVADMGADRAQAVVSGIAAADLDAHFGGRKIEFVVQHDDGVEVELMEAHRLADAAAGIVHEGLRRQQRDALRPDRTFGERALEARAERADAMLGGDRLDRHEADIVAVFRVTRAGIAEACDEQHGRPLEIKGPPA